MLIDGREIAQKILEKIKKRVEILQEEKNITPHLAIIRLGNDPATTSYVKQKERMGKKIGAVVSIYNYPENVKEKELLEGINFLQLKGDIHAMIIQLPLPKSLNEEKIIMSVDKDKDVDGFRPDSEFTEPIAAAVFKILKEIYELELKKPENKNINEFKTWLKSQKIVIMGKGKTGGFPIIKLLKQMEIEFTVIDSKTKNPTEIIHTADILICAVGNKGTLVTEDMVKKDAIIIGIGMHLGADGKLHGDYIVDEIKYKASYYTPIPGGVGPVNAAMLLVNLVEAAENN